MADPLNPLELMEETLAVSRLSRTASSQACAIAEKTDKSVKELAQEQKAIVEALSDLKVAVKAEKSLLEQQKQKKQAKHLLSLQIVCIGLAVALLAVIVNPRYNCLLSWQGRPYYQQDGFFCVYR